MKFKWWPLLSPAVRAATLVGLALMFVLYSNSQQANTTPLEVHQLESDLWVIEGTSKLPQYAYGKRLIFIDKEAWVVPYSDIFDRNNEAGCTTSGTPDSCTCAPLNVVFPLGDGGCCGGTWTLTITE